MRLHVSTRGRVFEYAVRGDALGGFAHALLFLTAAVLTASDTRCEMDCLMSEQRSERRRDEYCRQMSSYDDGIRHWRGLKG